MVGLGVQRALTFPCPCPRPWPCRWPRASFLEDRDGGGGKVQPRLIVDLRHDEPGQHDNALTMPKYLSKKRYSMPDNSLKVHPRETCAAG